MSSEAAVKKSRLRPRRFLRPITVHKDADVPFKTDDKKMKDNKKKDAEKKKEKKDVVWCNKDWSEALGKMRDILKQTRANNDLFLASLSTL